MYTLTKPSYQITIPQETVNDESVRVLSWKAPSGTVVAKDQVICEIETSKVVIEMCAPVAGVLQYHFAVGDEVAVGNALCAIDAETGEASANGSAVQGNAAPSPATAESYPGPTLAEDLPSARMTPSARKLAAEHRIDLSAFPTGSLVRKNDVLRMAGIEVPDLAVTISTPRQKRQSQALDRSEPVKSTPAVGVPIDWRNLPRKKAIEGKILQTGRATTVQSSVTARIKAPLLRARVRDLHQSDVALDALILFEVSRLLLQYPELNALHDGARIGSYRQINICWAIDSGRNLVAPVVKECERKTLGEIVAMMERQLEEYLENRLGLEDFNGGTFTVSNLSSDGICFFNPLISAGQAAILGVGSDVTAEGDETLYLTLAFDHQLAEGRTAARFLKDLGYRLEAHSTVQAHKTTSAVASSQAEPAAAYCVICQRDYALLQRSRAVLLKSEIPPGLVCSLCVGGF